MDSENYTVTASSSANNIVNKLQENPGKNVMYVRMILLFEFTRIALFFKHVASYCSFFLFFQLSPLKYSNVIKDNQNSKRCYLERAATRTLKR